MSDARFLRAGIWTGESPFFVDHPSVRGFFPRWRATIASPRRTGARRGELRRALVPAAAALVLAAAALVGTACRAGGAPAAPQPSNAFDDPFVVLSTQVDDCPTPRGPFVNAQEQLAQAHHRAERGASCYLAGTCDKASAYAYDKAIAAQLQAALQRSGLLQGSSLWLTVQARVAFIEGCVADMAVAPRLERLARDVPWLQQALVIVHVKGTRAPPYRLLDPAAARR